LLNLKPGYDQPLGAPVNVTWEITAKCNLRCCHCLSADTARTCASELDLAQCRALIDELDRMQVFQINFGGGEPFLRHDFVDILDYAHSKGITTCVSTNGTVHDASLAERLSRMELLRIQVSLDGAKAATNDIIRGAGTYERIIAGLDLFRKQGLTNLSINTVVTRLNFPEIQDLCGLARHFGIKTRLSRFRPSGNGKSIWHEYHLDSPQLAELSEFLNNHREVSTGDSFFSVTAENRQKTGLNLCGAARMTCSVLPDGSIYPCSFLQDRSFCGGNITRDSLKSVWLHAPAFRMLREISIEACENCPNFPRCHGGCPAVAYFLTRSLSEPDPECIASLKLRSPDHAGTI
jgi:mycofactocin biosynthetic radical S-adenosylmethionine protein MftC